MNFFRYFLPGMLIVFCLFCSCSTGGLDPEESTVIKELSPEEKEIEAKEKEKEKDVQEKETETETEEPDFIPDIPDEIPTMPVFLSRKMVSENEIHFEFSQPVTLVDLDFDPELEYESFEYGSTVQVILTENPGPGVLLVANLLVEDENGNTLNEEVSFRSLNDHVPSMQINELRTEYDGPNLKEEFIEFKILSDGNMGALRVFAAGNQKNPLLYEFNPVEVKAGEYVVLHLRKLEETCIDEYGDSLDESGGTNSCLTARDIWIQGSDKLLHKTDAVYVLDQDDMVLDAVMIVDKPDISWGKDYLAEAAGFLFDKGAWNSSEGTVCTPADAVNSTGIGTSKTRSISRDETVENTHTAADWYITANSGTTPGQPNNPKRL